MGLSSYHNRLGVRIKIDFEFVSHVDTQIRERGRAKSKST